MNIQQDLNQLNNLFYIHFILKMYRLGSLSVTLLIFALLSSVIALKLDHHQAVHVLKDHNQKIQNHLENPSNSSSCTKQYCISKFGLQIDPFNPACDEDAKCWRKHYGFPDCTDDDLKCWKQSVGYPKNCSDTDYDCWIKNFGYAQCDSAQCLKDYLNYTCKQNDLECWRTKTWLPACKWNDWDCWVTKNFLSLVCDQKKGFQCISSFYNNNCIETDQKCWRKSLNLPDADCQKDVACFKKFYFLPECKDDDFDCWKKLYWGPKCKKDDMACLKQFLFVPDCTTEKDEAQCYKKWLRYPDCKKDDGKCWKAYHDDQPKWPMMPLFDLGLSEMKAQKPIGFGQMMEHRRKEMAQDHKKTRMFHMKRAGLIKS